MSSTLIVDSSRATGSSGKAGDADATPHESGTTSVRLTPAPPEGVLTDSPTFPEITIRKLKNGTQRKNLHHITHAIRNKRIRVTGESDNWEEIRRADEETKNRVARHLPYYLEQFECNTTAAGATLHWARDAEEVNRIVIGLVRRTGESEVTKVKSMVTQEADLDEALGREHIAAWGADLTELIVQSGHNRPSYMLVPAIHRSRSEVREIFLREMEQCDTPCSPNVTDNPVELAGVVRIHLREKFMRTKVGISEANFVIVEAGSLMVVGSEGNGWMNLILPETSIPLVGIGKVLPASQDLEVFLQLLSCSSTGEWMASYGMVWTGKREGNDSKDVHVVLLDSGRTKVLRDKLGHATLRCIRCSACLNIYPVYERMDEHAYGSMYLGPTGAILNSQLCGVCSTVDRSLPFVSALCGACIEVCSVRIPFADILVNLRRKVVDVKRGEPGHATHIEPLLMKGGGWVMGYDQRLVLVGHLAEIVGALLRSSTRKIGKWSTPGMYRWLRVRDMPLPPTWSARIMWKREQQGNNDEYLGQRENFFAAP